VLFETGAQYAICAIMVRHCRPRKTNCSIKKNHRFFSIPKFQKKSRFITSVGGGVGAQVIRRMILAPKKIGKDLFF
jgi:hypothetical protein